MTKKVTALMLISICLLLFTTGGSCDRTELTGEVVLEDTRVERGKETGEVIVEDTRVELGQEVPLRLEVPAELEEIYWVFWEVEPPESAKIIDGAELLENYSDERLETYFGADEELNPDRIALLKPHLKGTCKVHVFGYFRQTNPQEIKTIQLEIVP